MSHKLVCPLCLKILAGEKLKRICLGELCGKEPSEEITVPRMAGEDEFTRFVQENLECTSKKCGCTLGVHTVPHNGAEGVLLAHIGCPVANPFYSEGKGVEVPEAAYAYIGLDWIVPAIRKVSEIGGDEWSKLREMWFPLCLLRASQVGVPANRKKAVMVGLVGTRGSGKSTLTSMSMSYRGWADYPGLVSDEYFLYEPPATATENTGEQFLGWIQHVDQLRAKDIKSLVRATKPESFYMVRVSFPKFKEPELREEPPDSLSVSIRRGIKNMFGPMLEMLRANGSRSSELTVPAIVMYDSAGEWTLNPWWKGDFLSNMQDRMDVLAVVIDPTAPDFPKGRDTVIAGMPKQPEGKPTFAKTAADPTYSSPTSLKETCGLLTGFYNFEPEDRPIICVLITKADIYFQGKKDVLKKLKGKGGFNEEARKRLLDMLEHGVTTEEKMVVERLRTFIGMKDLVQKVFFTWTEGIDGDSKKPRSYHLGDFLAWCLLKDQEQSPLEGG